jgi:hypothetical protein
MFVVIKQERYFFFEVKDTTVHLEQNENVLSCLRHLSKMRIHFFTRPQQYWHIDDVNVEMIYVGGI